MAKKKTVENPEEYGQESLRKTYARKKAIKALTEAKKLEKKKKFVKILNTDGSLKKIIEIKD